MEHDKRVEQETTLGNEELQIRPLPRHEIEPTSHFAFTPGPGKDSFLFYHMRAAKVDLNPLWAYCRYCVSSLMWVNDHFVVTPNPIYIVQCDDFEERFAKIRKVLLFWYKAKSWVGDIDTSGI